MEETRLVQKHGKGYLEIGGEDQDREILDCL